MTEPRPRASFDDGAATVPLDVDPATGHPARRRRPSTGPSPLGGVDYFTEAADLWRWVDAPQDRTVAEFVSRYARQEPAERDRTRSSLGIVDLHTLLTFTRRRALAAIRTGDRDEARIALDALSVIELDRVDWRDVWVEAALAAYAGHRAGLSLTDTVPAIVSRAEPQVGELLTEVTADAVDITGECGYREVNTPTGPVLVGDEGEGFAPEADLVGMALWVAGMLEEDRYRVDDVTVATELPAVWLGGDQDDTVRGALAGLTGCAQVHAEPRDDGRSGSGRQFLLVYLAEAATEEQASVIAEAAASGGPAGVVELGVAAGRRCALVIARSAIQFLAPVEDQASLDRFRLRLMALLPG